METPLVVVASGYFDPLHTGHLAYLQKSKALAGPGGRLIVVVNNDHQASLKKKRAFMPARERVRLVRALECVDVAIEAVDKDRSVCATLSIIHPDVFTNGGDQTNEAIPEAETCRVLGIRMVDGLGEKINSSSSILRNAYENPITLPLQ
jgi:D-beta-D-heptose 7-phosphate kinase/D-beta-D-heptose 1-phosphate adenosyltransferase